MSWISIEDRKPENGQWVVVPLGDGFMAGKFNGRFPDMPSVVNPFTVHAVSRFTHWKPLTAPKVKP